MTNKTIGELMDEYISKHTNNREKITGLVSIFDKYEVSPEIHEEIAEYTDEIDDDTIIYIVEHLTRRDGTVSGAHWTREETDSVAAQYDIKNKVETLGKTYCSIKFWLVMNYVYAVHYSISRTTSAFTELAIDEWTNKNVCFDDVIRKMLETE